MDTVDGLETMIEIPAVWAEAALRDAEPKPLGGGAGGGADLLVAGAATQDLMEEARVVPSPALYASDCVGLTPPRPTRSI